MTTPRGLKELQDIDEVFAALAHESRRNILLVVQARGGEMTSGAIAARFECSWPTTTRHLRVLERAGLLAVHLRGRERIYRLDTDRLQQVAGSWVERFQGDGTPGRRAPEHAEGPGRDRGGGPGRV